MAIKEYRGRMERDENHQNSALKTVKSEKNADVKSETESFGAAESQ
jgi:hypothetical protein